MNNMSFFSTRLQDIVALRYNIIYEESKKLLFHNIVQAIALAKKSNYAILESSDYFRQKSRGDCAFRKVDVTGMFNGINHESFMFRKRFPFRTDVEDLWVNPDQTFFYRTIPSLRTRSLNANYLSFTLSECFLAKKGCTFFFQSQRTRNTKLRFLVYVDCVRWYCFVNKKKLCTQSTNPKKTSDWYP